VISVEPIKGGLGARISGVAQKPQDERDFRREILGHLDFYQLLVLPCYSTSLSAFQALAQPLGRLIRHDFLSTAKGDRIHEIYKRPEDEQNFGGVWHSDGAYLQKPPRAIMLQAVHVPDDGGDTLFACQIAAYNALPDEQKTRLRDCRVLHTAASVFGEHPGSKTAGALQSACHPLVRHVSGRRAYALFHSGPCAQRVIGVTADESRKLLGEALSAATHSPLQYRHKWQAGDIVIWDNRSTMHKALNDYPGQPRLMRRAMIAG